MSNTLFLLLPLFSDTIALVLAGICAYFLRISHFFYVEPYIVNPTQYIRLLLTSLILWYFIVFISGFGKSKPAIFQIDELIKHFKSTIMLLFAVMAGTFLYKQYDFSRLIVFFSWFLFVLLGNIGRQIVGAIRRKLYKKSLGVRKVCLIGKTKTRIFLENRINDNISCGLKIEPLDSEEHIDDYLSEHAIDELFVFSEHVDYNKIWKFRECSLNKDLVIHLVPSFGNLYTRNLHGLFFDGTVLISLDSPLTRTFTLFIKRITDIFVSLLAIIIFSPFFILLPLVIKLTSKGPVFFIQKRVGKDEKMFNIIKFRSMNTNSNPYQETPTNSGDVRITPFGKLMRATGLDELPQFFNVLKGEMSVVGPRPEMPFIADKYTSIEKKRLKVKPGITGLWQVYARAERLPIHQHIEYDLYYVENLSIMLDVMILLDTIPTAILRKGV